MRAVEHFPLCRQRLCTGLSRRLRKDHCSHRTSQVLSARFMHLAAVLDWDIQHFDEEPGKGYVWNTVVQYATRGTDSSKYNMNITYLTSAQQDDDRWVSARILVRGSITKTDPADCYYWGVDASFHYIATGKMTHDAYWILVLTRIIASHTLDAISILDATGAVVDREFEIRARPTQHHLGTERWDLAPHTLKNITGSKSDSVFT